MVGIVLAAGVYFGLIPPQSTSIQPERQVTEQSAEASRAETDPVSTKEPTAEQPQQAILDPINQPVTEQPNSGTSPLLPTSTWVFGKPPTLPH